MSNTNGAHDTAGPLAVPMGTEGHYHYPAGWAAPERHDRAERERLAPEIEAGLSADARATVETDAQVTTEGAG